MFKSKEWWKNRRNQLRTIAIQKYGGKCKCCGEIENRFLCIDHLNGNGKNHRKTMTFANIYEWLRSKNYPIGFQVLCFNCNNAKQFGICPHQQLK